MTEAAQVKLGVLGWLRWGWRQLTTMRVALYLLVLVGIAAIPGSIFPQSNTSPGRVNQYKIDNPELSVWIERFDGFDVYGSVWFSGLYLLLMISLIGCIIPRARLHIAAWRTPLLQPPDSFARMDATFEINLEISQTEIRKILRKRRWKVKDFENAISAERGILRETGNLAFHVSILAILVAVALGTGFGYRGQVILREGVGFSNVLAQYDSFSAGSYFGTEDLRPFSMTLDKLEVDFQTQGPTVGAPSDFRAYVTYRESADSEVKSTVVSVNHPLNVGNASMFLLGHGYAPRFKITAPDGTVVFDDAVIFLPNDGNFTSIGVVKIPDVEPQLGLDGIFAPTGVIDELLGPVSVFPDLIDPMIYVSAWVGDLGLDDGVAQNVYLLDKTNLENKGLAELSLGDEWELPENLGTLEFVGVDRFATFNVAADPGQSWALLAATMTILGVIAALYVQRGFLWVRRTKTGWEFGIVGKDVEKYVTSIEADLARHGIALENKHMADTADLGENA
jgi:cytochrome c biogenesis protein